MLPALVPLLRSQGVGAPHSLRLFFLLTSPSSVSKALTFFFFFFNALLRSKTLLFLLQADLGNQCQG